MRANREQQEEAIRREARAVSAGYDNQMELKCPFLRFIKKISLSLYYMSYNYLYKKYSKMNDKNPFKFHTHRWEIKHFFRFMLYELIRGDVQFHKKII